MNGHYVNCGCNNCRYDRDMAALPPYNAEELAAEIQQLKDKDPEFLKGMQLLYVSVTTSVPDATGEEPVPTTTRQIPNNKVSVLQDWVSQLPLREQGTLLTAVRGCDLTPKYPLDSVERMLVGWIRWCFMVPADPREVDREPGCFFISTPLFDYTSDRVLFKPSALGHYPQHWLSHLIHAYEVVGYRHPDVDVARAARYIYYAFCHSLHMNVESIRQFEGRLSTDRILSGEVVS